MRFKTEVVLVTLRENERTPGKRVGAIFCAPFWVTRAVRAEVGR